jgi:hypothetical protein
MTQRLRLSLTLQCLCRLQCSSARCVWNWYFSLSDSAITHISALYPTAPFCLFLSTLPQPASSNLPELHSTFPQFSVRLSINIPNTCEDYRIAQTLGLLIMQPPPQALFYILCSGSTCSPAHIYIYCLIRYY